MDAHSDRIAELRALVSQIAADVGLESTQILQGEVEALGQRLDNVRNSITTLAGIAEARAINEQQCTKNINQTKTYLNNMQQVGH